MIRHRVAIPTLRATSRQHPDLSVAIADITTREQSISVPSIIAQVMKDVLRERPPISTYTPFITEPAFSGADTELESTANHTTVTPVTGGLRIKGDTVLLPMTNPVQIRLYLTGMEVDLPIIGQKCTVEVSDSKGCSKRVAVAKHDEKKMLYLEIQDRGVSWRTCNQTEVIRFHFDNVFTLNSSER